VGKGFCAIDAYHVGNGVAIASSSIEFFTKHIIGMTFSITQVVSELTVAKGKWDH